MGLLDKRYGALCACIALFLVGVANGADITSQVSRPAGFVRHPIPAKSWSLVGLPLEPFYGDLDTLVGQQLRGGTNNAASDTIMGWDAVNQNYLYAYKVEGVRTVAPDGRWVASIDDNDHSTAHFSAGDGLFVGSRTPFDQQLFLCGHLPTNRSMEQALGPALTMISSPFPSALALASSPFAESAVAQNSTLHMDQFISWNNNRYTFRLYFDASLYPDFPDTLPSGWLDPDSTATDFVLPLNEGAWYQRRNAGTYFCRAARPYDVPFGSPGSPQITYLRANEEAALLVYTVSADVASVDVFVQDVVSNGTFDARSWALAETDIPIDTQFNYWFDSASENRPPVTSTVCRFYAVARADIDSDADTLPDAREVFIYRSDPTCPDSDGDGLSDASELNRGTCMTNDQSVNATILVDALTGDDCNDGFIAPLRQVTTGLAKSIDGDRVQVGAGNYSAGHWRVTADVTLTPSGTVVVR